MECVVQESVPKVGAGPRNPKFFIATNGFGLRGPNLQIFLYRDEWQFFIATNGPCWAASGVQKPAIPYAGNASFSLILAVLGSKMAKFPGALRAPDGGPGPRNFFIATNGPFF